MGETAEYYVQKGTEYSKKGFDSEARGDFMEAAQLYTETMRHLSLALQLEISDSKKDILQKVLATHKSRVKELISRSFQPRTTEDKKGGTIERHAELTAASEKIERGTHEETGGNDRENTFQQTWVKPNVPWSAVVGLTAAKAALREAIVIPIKYPQLFNAKRRPWSRVLLYGPPGTGKTQLACAVATETDSVVYSLSSSDLLSRWYGESEKSIKRLFQEASSHPSSVLFFDEIDALCRSRNESEDEATRRIKTELLRQMDGLNARSEKSGRVIVLAATNRPWELDDAFLRRFQKRLYVPMPEVEVRKSIVEQNLEGYHDMTPEELKDISTVTKGYSGSDLSNLCNDAMMEPLREIYSARWWVIDGIESKGKLVYRPWKGPGSKLGLVEAKMEDIPTDQLAPPRQVTAKDVMNSIKRCKPSVNASEMDRYEEFTLKYGESGA
ncbi:hypothetical protein PROFUN_02548 [Planoprotostelium fungivorum]|uniref:AAA+ ATPase domain-containing protein n=1 Tax=Planoprotostelium fungivorum TaxID=1890364 RepID=A0A2P6MPA2_9EUKA|nr:hypothetical protein PROFUN_02548 [Planoprotostelium fungivorum]